MNHYDKNLILIKKIIESNYLTKIYFNTDTNYGISNDIGLYKDDVYCNKIDYKIDYDIDNISKWITATMFMENKQTYNYVFLSKIKINDELYDKFIGKDE